MKNINSKSRKILAKNVLYLRYKNKWSQEELASRAQISSTFISDIENAKSNVGIDYVDNIAHAFGINSPELLTDHGYRVSKTRVDSRK